MTEIYVAHEVVFNKIFNKRTLYHGSLLGCNFDNQFLISKEVVLLTVDKERNLCYLDSMKPCKLIDYTNLKKSVTLFECRFCSKRLSNDRICEQSANIKSEVMGVINIMPISEFTKIGYIPIAIDLVKQYNDSVRGEFETVTDKSYRDTVIKINSGFARIRRKKED